MGRDLAVIAAILSAGTAVAALAGPLDLATPVSVVIIAIAAVFMAGVWSLTWRVNARESEDLPVPERRRYVPVPGGRIEDVLAEFRAWSPGYTTSDRRVIEGLHGAATAVLTRFRGVTVESARAQLADGTWTDDEHAARFLADPDVDRTERRSWRGRLALALPIEWLARWPMGDRLTRWLERDSGYLRGLRHSAAAIAGIARDERVDPSTLALEGDVDPADGPVRTVDRENADRPLDRSVSTGYWRGIGFVALLTVPAGILWEAPGLFLAAAVLAGYAGVAAATRPRTPRLSIERTLEPRNPEPGESVAVELSITNEREAMLPDVRIVDGVPPALAVSEGSPRLGTTLRPGETVTHEYAVTAERGVHAFDPALVRTRSPGQAFERETLIEGETSIVARDVHRPIFGPIPLRATASRVGGTLTTADSGPGTAFHSVRDYRRGDPLNRVDWKRRARTGELSTVEFHAERVATVLLLVDARRAAYYAPEPGGAHAVDRSIQAAGRIGATLLGEGDEVGLAAIGPSGRRIDPAEGERCWLTPGAGRRHREALDRTLATHPQLSTNPPEISVRWTEQLHAIDRRLGEGTQVMLFTPLVDANAAAIARLLEALGHPITVISPDPTGTGTAGEQLAGVARRIRRFDLQRSGIPVLNWASDESLESALARAAARDSR